MSTTKVTREMLLIRSPQPEDTRQLGDIAVAAWEPVFASFRSLVGDEMFAQVYPDWRSDKRRQVEDRVTDAPESFRVTELADAVVGFISWRLDHQRGVGEICNNAVDPQFQNRGIGTIQYQVALEHFREQGMVVAKVTTGLDESHAPARSAYHKAGFEHAIPMVTYYRQL